MIAVDQDALGASGKVIARSQDGFTEVDAKPLVTFGSGQFAVLLLNRGETPRTIGVTWKSLGVRGSRVKVRDLWEHKDLSVSGPGFTSAEIPPHGIQMLRVEGDPDWTLPREYGAESSYNTLSGVARVHSVETSEWDLQIRLQTPPTHASHSSPSAAFVEGLGNGPANKIQMNEIWAGEEGLHAVVLHYASAADVRARIAVNHEPPILVSFPATGGADTFHEQRMSLPLQAGKNSLIIDNPDGPAPAIDKLVVLGRSGARGPRETDRLRGPSAHR